MKKVKAPLCWCDFACSNCSRADSCSASCSCEGAPCWGQCAQAGTPAGYASTLLGSHIQYSLPHPPRPCLDFYSNSFLARVPASAEQSPAELTLQSPRSLSWEREAHRSSQYYLERDYLRRSNFKSSQLIKPLTSSFPSYFQETHSQGRGRWRQADSSAVSSDRVMDKSEGTPH